jgi:methionyl-tRNA formyltransferase
MNYQKKILLCISSNFGIKIFNLLKKKKFHIDIYSSNSNLNLKKKKFFYIKNKKNFTNKLFKFKKKYDFIILVYWPWIVVKKNFSKFSNSINFHPALLPYGRGWYPHVHSKIKKFPYGVTLHMIDYGIDTGKIWCQEKIIIPDFCTSDQIYNIAQKKIYWLFKKNFNKIINNRIIAYKQDKKTKYLNKKLIFDLDKINLNKKQKIIDFINYVRLRMFKKNSFCYIIHQNKKKFIKITFK